MFDLNDNSAKQKLMDYEMIYVEGKYATSYDNYRELQDKVNQRISEGWEPQGGVTIGNLGDDRISVCQAMIKRNKKITEEKELNANKIEIRRVD